MIKFGKCVILLDKRVILVYLIAGLGNPGAKYRYTRHNVGFVAVDYLGLRFGIKINKIKFKSIYGEGQVGGEKVLLAKPQTFMNNSGEAIGEIVRYYKIPVQNIIIIYDDIALDVGRLRVRPSGSAGGHNGMKSIIYHLESDNFPRVRIGIGKQREDLIDHVLGTFPKEDGIMVTKCVKDVDKIVETIIKDGVESAMNKFNGVAYE